MASAPHLDRLQELRTRGVVGVAAHATARERTLPVVDALTSLLPAVQRGSVVACEGAAAVSLALAVVAGPSAAGAWVGVAGLPSLGLAAAAEAGVDLARLVAVVEPCQVGASAAPVNGVVADEGGRFDGLHWAELLAAMVDGFDVLLLGPELRRVSEGTARRIVARLQSRGAVAITVGLPAFGADLRLRSTGARWQGLGEGHGVARGRVAGVELSGRRVPSPRRADLWLPGADGRPAAVEGDVAVLPLRRTG